MPQLQWPREQTSAPSESKLEALLADNLC